MENHHIVGWKMVTEHHANTGARTHNLSIKSPFRLRAQSANHSATSDHTHTHTHTHTRTHAYTHARMHAHAHTHTHTCTHTHTHTHANTITYVHCTHTLVQQTCCFRSLVIATDSYKRRQTSYDIAMQVRFYEAWICTFSTCDTML